MATLNDITQELVNQINETKTQFNKRKEFISKNQEAGMNDFSGYMEGVINKLNKTIEETNYKFFKQHGGIHLQENGGWKTHTLITWDSTTIRVMNPSHEYQYNDEMLTPYVLSGISKMYPEILEKYFESRNLPLSVYQQLNQIREDLHNKTEQLNKDIYNYLLNSLLSGEVLELPSQLYINNYSFDKIQYTRKDNNRKTGTLTIWFRGEETTFNQKKRVESIEDWVQQMKISIMSNILKTVY